MVVLYFWCAMGLAEESGVVGMLEKWGFGRYYAVDVWMGAMPHCVMWTI